MTRDVPSSYRNPNDVSGTYPAGTTTYTVNALGQRVAKSGPLGSSRFVYDGQNTLMSEQVNGQWTDHIWMGGEPIGLVRGGQLYFVHADRLGRPEVVSHPDGHARWIAANHAYDRAVVGNSLGAYNLGLPGQYFDAETGHWYNGFRDYDGRTGSYLQSDPIGLAGGLNTYAYVGGNPVSYADPLGLQAAPAIPYAPPSPWWGAIPRILGLGSGPGGVIVGAFLPTSMGYSACESMGPGACARMYNESSEGGSCPTEGKGQRGIPTRGEPGTWADHPAGKQSRLYGPDGRPAFDIDRGHNHGQDSPHAHPWVDGVRGPGVPVSDWPGGG